MSRELDVRVARALGWREVQGPTKDYDGPVESFRVLVPPTLTDDQAYKMMPAFGTVQPWFFCKPWQSDVAAAWTLMEMAYDAGCVLTIGTLAQKPRGYRVELLDMRGDEFTEHPLVIEKNADTATEAISEAWLAWKEADDAHS